MTRNAKQRWVILGTILLAAAPALAAPRAIVLKNARLQASISPATGQVMGISDPAGRPLLASNEDRYTLDDKEARESSDRVTAVRQSPNEVRLSCASPDLGLTVLKTYRLRGNVLEKQVEYATAAPEKRLLQIHTTDRPAAEFYRSGYFYFPTDDGYKVWTSPFIAESDVKAEMHWPVTAGSIFLYYNPGRQKVLMHQSQRINGVDQYVTMSPTDGAALLPGGARILLGRSFVGGGEKMVLENEHAVFSGDPREYHRYVLTRPPYSRFAGGAVPEWFRKSVFYLSDGASGSGRGLIEDRNAVARDVTSFLKLIRPDQYLMIFFNHWATSGDYPYQGIFRYMTYTEKGWSDPVPVEKLRENIRWLKSLDPRIKVGGYVMFSPVVGTPPYEQHKDWLTKERDGKLQFGGDGIGPGGVADITSGYREYMLDQMKHAVTDTGFDWIHIDYGPFENVNWGTQHVIQNGEAAIFYERLGKILDANNAVIVENGAPMSALWAQGSYYELQQPERWEKKDWRTLAVQGYLNGLYRASRPGTWVNNCYGTVGMHGLRNAFSGMRGWIRNGMNWYRDTAHGLAHEKVVDELLATRESRILVHPTWWRMETPNLELEPLDAGHALIIPLLLHGDQPGPQELFFSSRETGWKTGNLLFAFDLKLSRPEPLDVFKPAPWTAPYMELTGFSAGNPPAGEYRHRMDLETARNYYHCLTQVPAWVYTVDGERTAFLLPENRGVVIRGSCAAGAASYRLTVTNANARAQVLAYCPKEWKGARVLCNGRPVRNEPIEVLGQPCLLFEIPSGKATVTVARAASQPREAFAPTRYRNPEENVWRESAPRALYTNLEPTAFRESGRNCLSLKEVPGAAGGTVMFPTLYQTGPASGMHLWLRGENTGRSLRVTLSAGDAWTYDIKDDFTGWKEFSILREQMTTASAGRKWGSVGAFTFTLPPSQGKPMIIADPYLLPPRPQDIVEKKEAKKRVVAYRVAVAPAIDGFDNDPAWKDCTPLSGFFRSGGGPAAGQTIVKVCYDDQNLYVFVNNVEPIEKTAAPQKRGSQIWSSDHVELFVDPFRDGINWFHLLVDTGGTMEDERYAAAGRNPNWGGDWEVKTALNWRASWTAEYRVPFRSLERTPKTGDVWGINFARLDIANEWSNWSTPGEFLESAGFGEILFAGEPGKQQL